MDVLVVDGQLLQTSAYPRGMGRYSLALLRALREALRGQGDAHLEVVLSQELPHPDELASLLPGIRLTHLPLSVSRRGTGALAERNRGTLEAHLDALVRQGLTPAFLSLDVLLGETTAVLPRRSDVPSGVVVYDLIPLRMHEVYLPHPGAADVYLSRLGAVLRADRVLTISRTVASELEDHLGIDPERVRVIGGGPVQHAADGERAVLPAGVRAPYVLLPTAADVRKNNRRAVQAFELFRTRGGRDHQLVVTSALPAQQRDVLSRMSEAVVLTGRVSGPELESLYAGAEAVLLPSEAEGLGLPLLEAVQRARPVACSDLPVFREISASAFSFFDPTSVDEIADGLQRACGTPVEAVEYERIRQTWTWQRTAHAVLSALEEPAVPSEPRQKLLVATPRAHTRTGQRVQREHAELIRRHDVTYLLSGDEQPTAPGPHEHLSHHASALDLTPGVAIEPEDYDQVVIHLDDDEGAGACLLMALAVPAVVVLHAPRVWRAWEGAVRDGLISSAREALERSLGDDGLASVRARALSLQTL